jgi:hypothetical protein
MTNEHQNDKTEVKAEPKSETPEPIEYIEFVGDPQYGTEFHSEHTVSAAHMRQYHDVDLGTKVVAWNKQNHFRVPASDITPEAASILEADPMFKRVKR